MRQAEAFSQAKQPPTAEVNLNCLKLDYIAGKDAKGNAEPKIVFHIQSISRAPLYVSYTVLKPQLAWSEFRADTSARCIWQEFGKDSPAFDPVSRALQQTSEMELDENEGGCWCGLVAAVLFFRSWSKGFVGGYSGEKSTT